MKHRLFFAIEFHDEVKRELYEHADKYAGPIGLRVTTPGHLHITLRFLGDTDEALVPELTGEKMDFLSELVGLKCKFTNFGFFYNNRLPSVFFINCEISKQLFNITSGLENILTELGFPKSDKRFIPHMTFSRLKRDPGKNFMTEVLSAAPLNIETEIAKTVLFKSELQRRGAVYTVLKQY